MALHIKTWIDGLSYSEYIPQELSKFFNSNSVNGSKNLSYVGFHLHKDSLNIMLPKNMKRDTVGTVEDAVLLLNIIQIGAESDSVTDGNLNSVESDMFTVVNWLIKDFKHNGIVRTRSFEQHKTKGKVLWQKTIKNKLGFIQDDEIAIVDTLNRKRYADYDELSAIHEFVIVEIADMYGWIFNNFRYQSFRSHGINLDNLPIERILKTAKLKTNVLREKRLIQMLQLYLQLIRENNTDLSIVTPEFHVIFEKLMKKQINHDESLQSNVPKATWNFTLPGESSSFTAFNRQVPDGLQIRDGILNIYDAKYYSLDKVYDYHGRNVNPPLDWYSVGKQFFYELSIGLSNQITMGDNFFVFPYKNSWFDIVGDIKIELQDGTEKNIKIMVVDPMELLRVGNKM